MKTALFITTVFTLATSLFAEDLIVRSSTGELHVIHLKPEDTVSETIEVLRESLNAKGEFIIDFMASPSQKMHTKDEIAFRDYSIPLSSDEKKDIKYIVTTLGMKSLFSISGAKSSLKKAGKRIDHIHPFRFLGYIFSDEEMKAAMKAMEGRSWVWSEFLDGIKDTLEYESKRDNLPFEFMADFAERIGVKVDLIVPLINQRSWESLVSTLIREVPRTTETRRYNDV